MHMLSLCCCGFFFSKRSCRRSCRLDDDRSKRILSAELAGFDFFRPNGVQIIKYAVAGNVVLRIKFDGFFNWSHWQWNWFKQNRSHPKTGTERSQNRSYQNYAGKKRMRNTFIHINAIWELLRQLQARKHKFSIEWHKRILRPGWLRLFLQCP